MSNEKTSEGADWRGRLDRLDALPDTDGAWRGPAWEKLHARLQEKEEQPRRKIGWYWAAAACLVIVVAISLLPGKVVRPGRPGQPGYAAASGQPGRAVGPDQPDGPTESGMTLPSAGATSVGVTSAGHSHPSVEITHPIALARRDQLSGRSVPGRDQLKEQPVVVAAGTEQSSVFTDSTVLAATAPPLVPAAKRRLRVVHINELGLPVPEDSPSSHMAGNFFLRIRLFNNDAPANNMMGSNNEINLTQSFKISFKN